MKYLRNILSVLLSFSLCFSLVVPAFAATVNCPKGGKHECSTPQSVETHNGKAVDYGYCNKCGRPVSCDSGNKNDWHEGWPQEAGEPVWPECEHKDPETGESWLKEETTKAPTCTQQGSKTISCTHCDYTETETISALGHQWTAFTDDCESNTAPGCTTHSKECTASWHVEDPNVDGAKKVTENHSFGAWTLVEYKEDWTFVESFVRGDKVVSVYHQTATVRRDCGVCDHYETATATYDDTKGLPQETFEKEEERPLGSKLVIVKHVEKDTNDVLADEQSFTLTENSTESVTAVAVTIEGYKYDSVSDGGAYTYSDIEGDTLTLYVYYTRNEDTPPQDGTYTVVVKYQDDMGRELKTDWSTTINVGTGYDVSEQKFATITEDGVTYSLSNGDTVVMSGESGVKDATLTITLVYTADVVDTTPVEASYIVKWVDEDGNPIKNEETRTGNIGETVKVTDADKVIEDYTYVSGTESATLEENGTELILVFKQSTTPEPGTYTLTVSHIYRNAQGNVVRQTSETSDATYHSGDSYTTTDRSRTGFTLSGRPANASGTFGSANITVTYYYDAEPVPPEETVRTTPENPNQNQPAEEIPEPEIPLAEVPVEDDVEIPEPEIPLAETPEEIEIEEPAVPLADVPQTGDGISLWYVTAAVSALGLTLLLITGKKKEQEI